MLSLAMEELGNLWLTVLYAAQMAAASPAAPLTSCFPSLLMVGRLSSPLQLYEIIEMENVLFIFYRKRIPSGSKALSFFSGAGPDH